jgi:hypothetical protein
MWLVAQCFSFGSPLRESFHAETGFSVPSLVAEVVFYSGRHFRSL